MKTLGHLVQSNLAEAAEIAEYDMVNFRSWQRSQIKRQLVYALKVACEHDEAKLEEVAKFKMQWKIRAAGRFLFRNVICDMAKAGYALKPPLKAAKTLIVHSSRCTNLQSEKTIGKTRATVAGVFPIFLFLI